MLCDKFVSYLHFKVGSFTYSINYLCYTYTGTVLVWNNTVCQVIVDCKVCVPHGADHGMFAFTDGNGLSCFHVLCLVYNCQGKCMTVVT